MIFFKIDKYDPLERSATMDFEGTYHQPQKNHLHMVIFEPILGGAPVIFLLNAYKTNFDNL